jgi:molybdopterin converting factor subunit 1
MKTTLLAFGIAKEILNGAAINIELDEATTVGKLKDRLQEEYPKLKELRSFFIAVNNRYAPTDQVLELEDEIALIPPVSGG